MSARVLLCTPLLERLVIDWCSLSYQTRSVSVSCALYLLNPPLLAAAVPAFRKLTSPDLHSWAGLLAHQAVSTLVQVPSFPKARAILPKRRCDYIAPLPKTSQRLPLPPGKNPRSLLIWLLSIFLEPPPIATLPGIIFLHLS